MSFAVLVIFFTGCKPDNELVDYRERYTGEWQFDVTVSEFNMVDSFYFEEKINYVGDVSLGTVDKEILIHYLEDNYITLAVDDDGVLSGFSTEYSSGEFEDTNHLRIFIRWGGLGGGGSHSINATR
jgi:hypothetical protein